MGLGRLVCNVAWRIDNMWSEKVTHLSLTHLQHRGFQCRKDAIGNLMEREVLCRNQNKRGGASTSRLGPSTSNKASALVAAVKPHRVGHIMYIMLGANEVCSLAYCNYHTNTGRVRLSEGLGDVVWFVLCLAISQGSLDTLLKQWLHDGECFGCSSCCATSSERGKWSNVHMRVRIATSRIVCHL